MAVAQGEQLVIYLDRFATNEPVRDAKIEIETPEGPVAADSGRQVPTGSRPPWLGKPGHYDLIVTVTAGDDTDVLPLTIDVPDRSVADNRRAYRLDVPPERRAPAGDRRGRRCRISARSSWRCRSAGASRLQRQCLFAAMIALAGGAVSARGHIHDDATTPTVG